MRAARQGLSAGAPGSNYAEKVAAAKRKTQNAKRKTQKNLATFAKEALIYSVRPELVEGQSPYFQ
ncbi:MAG: hypothetical protein CVU16_07175 [Betaproteobacteria bacterium HGW-Betaproteobacteria-10]|nr:MAG: hypothetical protein CVU16_07175 [Betaproteobacteria bacterium HGW-Betaproteobacteria-10]